MKYQTRASNWKSLYGITDPRRAPYGEEGVFCIKGKYELWVDYAELTGLEWSIRLVKNTDVVLAQELTPSVEAGKVAAKKALKAYTTHFRGRR